MGLTLISVNKASAEIRCPLVPNINHKGTAFGGSISAAHLLGCYAWLFHFLNIEKIEAHLVVKESRVQFFRPVERDFTVVCLAPELDLLQNFLKVLNKKGRAKLLLNSKIEDNNSILSAMAAEFVATRSHTD